MFGRVLGYLLGHFEVPPFSRDTLRSVYHVRASDVYRMKSVRETRGERGRERERERGREGEGEGERERAM